MEFFLKFFWNLSSGFFWSNLLGENFWKDFFGRIFWEDLLGGFIGRIVLKGILWEEFFVYIGIDLFVKILVFVKILSKWRRKEK